MRRRARLILWMLSLGSCLWFGPVSNLEALTITYNNFSDLSAFTLNGATAAIGNPVYYNGQNVLRLTNALNQGGSAFLTQPVVLEDAGGFQASFSTFFSFQISNPQGISDEDGVGADGIVFVVQTLASNVGGVGGGIGYAGISPSVGVEFDTYNNGGPDGSNGNHIGINLNGSTSSLARYNVPTRMNDGNIWYSWVDYNGDTDLLEVRLSQTGSRPDTAQLSYTVDLVDVLGRPDAYIGFTSGTGAASGLHDLRSWQFNSTYDPITNQVPLPAAVWLLGSGLLGLFGLGRRFLV